MFQKIKVYVDGQSGTTGLQIHRRLNNHPCVELIKIPEEKRKDNQLRREIMNSVDVVFLCLPDSAAKEAATFIDLENSRTRLIDASTCHRTDPAWVYGLPEISEEQREKIKTSRRVSVPGCHSTAFILPLYPLVQKGIVPADYPVSSHSLTGYSGGGKQMIAEYTDPQRAVKYPDYDAPRQYALEQKHKHLPEMQKYTGLAYPPAFSPIVGDFERGLAVFTPLHSRLLPAFHGKRVTPELVHQVLADHYRGQQFVEVMPFNPAMCLESGFFNVKACNNTNRAEIFVFGNEDRIMLTCRIDNLGKGASGAAVQNMNLMCGFPEELGLV